MDLTEELIREKLREVIDPEVNLNIVDMGLIYGLKIDQGKVTVTMTLTTRGCPMRTYMENAVNEALGNLEGVQEVEIDLVWDPPWTPEKIDRAALEQLNQGGY